MITDQSVDVGLQLQLLITTSDWLVLLLDQQGHVLAVSEGAATALRVSPGQPWASSLRSPSEADELLAQARIDHLTQRILSTQTDGTYEFVVTHLSEGLQGYLVSLLQPDTPARQRRLIELLTSATNAVQDVKDLNELFTTLALTLNHGGLVVESCVPGPDQTIVLNSGHWQSQLRNLVPLHFWQEDGNLLLPVSHHIAQHLLETSQVALLNHEQLQSIFGQDARIELITQLVGPSGWICTRLQLTEEHKGLLLFGGPLLRPTDAPLVNLFGQHLQSIIRQLLLTEQRLREEARRGALLLVSEAVSRPADMSEVFYVACTQVFEQIGAELASITLLDPNPAYWRYGMAVGMGADIVLGLRTPVDSSLVGAIMRGNRSEIIPNILEDPRVNPELAKVSVMHSGIFVPLRLQGEVIGVMLGTHRHINRFNAADLALLDQIGMLVTLALQRDALQTRLNRAEERYRTLYDNASDLAFSFDLDGYLIHWNAATLRFLGLSIAEIRADRLKITDILPSKPDEPNYEREQRLLAGVPIRTPLQLEVIRPNGRPAILEVTSQLILEQGRAVGVAVVAHDITEREQVQRLLRAQIDKLTLLSSLAAILSTSFDLPTILDQAATSLSHAASTGTLSIYLITPNGQYRRQIARGLGAQAPLVLDAHPVFSDALMLHKPLMVSNTSITNPTTPTPNAGTLLALPLFTNQQTQGLVLLDDLSPAMLERDQVQFLQTITDQVAQVVANTQLYQQVEASAAQYRDLYENANDLIGTVAMDGRFLSLNRALLSFLGYDAADAATLHLRDLLPTQDQSRLARLYKQVFRRAEAGSLTYEQQVRRRDGSLATLEIRSRITQTADEPYVVHFIARDITARRALEAQVRQSEKLAALGQMVAGTAHEINNPLAVVLGTTQLLQLNELPPQLAEDVSVIETAALRARHIVQQLLTFARQQPPTLTKVNMQEVVQSALAALRDEIQQADITIKLELARRPLVVQGDPIQLQQVFINLLQNAIQILNEHTPPRIISVNSFISGSMVQLRVRDNGPGIPPLVMPRLFDPFFTTKALGLGTGLGLSIVYGIVESHHGRVWAESPPGEGATFIVEMPLTSESIAFGAEPLVLEPARPQILIIEDEPFVRNLLERALSQRPYRITSAANSKAAQRLLKRQRFDLIVSDLRMPDLPGRDLYTHVVTHAPTTNWLFVTGDTFSPENAAFLDTINVPVLEKPFTLADLWAIVENLTDIAE